MKAGAENPVPFSLASDASNKGSQTFSNYHEVLLYKQRRPE
jgi:hypothetical protein